MRVSAADGPAEERLRVPVREGWWRCEAKRAVGMVVGLRSVLLGRRRDMRVDGWEARRRARWARARGSMVQSWLRCGFLKRMFQSLCR